MQAKKVAYTQAPRAKNSHSKKKVTTGVGGEGEYYRTVIYGVPDADGNPKTTTVIERISPSQEHRGKALYSTFS